jgi:kinesin family protein C2/C3
MKLGAKNRVTSETIFNEDSSRSHLIITLELEFVSSGQKVSSKLLLVDLAGSENAHSNATHVMAETRSINKSLCALNDVLSSLSHGKAHIPYRNSKLTHYLQDSIGGDSKMVLLLCVDPSSKNIKETVYSLNYGALARQIKREQAKKHTEEDIPELTEIESSSEGLLELTSQIGATVKKISKLNKDASKKKTTKSS